MHIFSVALPIQKLLRSKLNFSFSKISYEVSKNVGEKVIKATKIFCTCHCKPANMGVLFVSHWAHSQKVMRA